MNDRPEWAQGPEWEGWKRTPVLNSAMVEKRLIDTVGNVWTFFISRGGSMLVMPKDVSIQFPSAERARVAAIGMFEGMK